MISGAALVAGVVGAPVRHSLSPVIHNAWLAGTGIDGAYVPFTVAAGGFARFVGGLRGGAVRGLNVTVPFKVEALALADRADAAAQAAGAANLLLFGDDGSVEARNTDGLGVLGALAEQAPGWAAGAGPVVILGAGGGAQGAAAALFSPSVEERPGAEAKQHAWSPKRATSPKATTHRLPPPPSPARFVNRTLARAEALVDRFGGRAFGWEALDAALDGAVLVINATTRGLNGVEPLEFAWPAPPPGAAALDMVYRPLRTAFLEGASRAGWATADGLAMLIAQARPSFAAVYGRPAPDEVDVRALCLAEMERR